MAWVTAGPIFEDIKTIIKEINRLQFKNTVYEKEFNEDNQKSQSFQQCTTYLC